MAKGIFVLYRIKGLGFPTAGFSIFNISAAQLVKLGFANIVEQAAKGKAFPAVGFFV